MYGFSQIKDGKLFVGFELIQVCIGANEVILRFFPDGSSITVFSVQKFLTDNTFMFEPLIGMQKRIRQLGKTVTRFEVKDQRTAAITFSDGAEILFRDDSDEFEAVTFQYEDRMIVV